MFFTGKKDNKEWLSTFYEYGLMACILFLALWLRKELLPFISVDMVNFYLPWYNFIVSHGALHAFKFNFTIMNVPGLYLYAIATYFPFSAPTNIKLLSIAFDMVLAGFMYLIVREKYGRTLIPFVAACVILFLPTVFLNSSLWGESDSSYVAISLGAIYFLANKRYLWSFVLWGLAISLKLQAVFVFPVLLTVFLSGEVPLLYFLLIPAVYVITLLPALIEGRSLIDLLSIYLSQSNNSQCLTLNAPNIYQWFGQGCYYVEQIKQGGLIFTLALVLLVSLIVLRSRQKLTPVRIIRLSLLFSLLLPFFLPMMHERYFYLADVLSIVYAFYVPKRFYVAIIVELASLLSYMPFLFGGPSIFHAPSIILPYVAFAPLVAMIVVAWDLIVDLYLSEPHITDRQGHPTGQAELSAAGDKEPVDNTFSLVKKES